VLGVGYWVLGIGRWVLGVGYWVLGVGYWVWGVGCGNNGNYDFLKEWASQIYSGFLYK
jgi:hypothetical protein